MDMNQNRQRQAKQGLYRPAYEHDACGVGLVVNVGGGKSHEIVENGLQVYKATDNEQFSAYISGILEGKLCRLTEAGYQVAKSRDLQKQADLLKHYYESVCRNTENYGN